MTKCVICDQRPSREDGLCQNCADKLDSAKRHNGNGEPRYFLTYHGHVIGLYPNGGGMLTPRLLQRNPDKLPKSKTINLNVFCEGFDRDQIKRFKACVLSTANA
ncbi:MAG TPA: hypothetical protein VMW64_02340 [Dehalococcoidia bacterium]|nr:hypothetical protein [Dehalococcoidia bacterium]